MLETEVYEISPSRQFQCRLSIDESQTWPRRLNQFNCTGFFNAGSMAFKPAEGKVGEFVLIAANSGAAVSKNLIH
jgi:hypothetical protein